MSWLTSQPPFMATRKVPIADGDEDQKLTFAVVTRRCTTELDPAPHLTLNFFG